MVTGHRFTTRRKIKTKPLEKNTDPILKLSIQVSLNGLSFCVLDDIRKEVTLGYSDSFEKELTPYEVQKKLKEAFAEHRIESYSFEEVVVIHRNLLFSLVPEALFIEEELPNYLKFNAKMLANDHVVFDDVEGLEIKNVYIPYTNLNNYIYELFGEFEFKHSGTVLLETLKKLHNSSKLPVVYVHLYNGQMDMAVFVQKNLLFFNSFSFGCKEDFMYYLLFTLEQLKLETETLKLRLFGEIEEGDPYFELCEAYIENVGIFIPDGPFYVEKNPDSSIDFTVINAL